MTEINHAIGAEGIVSQECKEVVSQYGNMIWDLLISRVSEFIIFATSHSPYITVIFSFQGKMLKLNFHVNRYNLMQYVHRLVYVTSMGLRLRGQEVHTGSWSVHSQSSHYKIHLLSEGSHRSTFQEMVVFC